MSSFEAALKAARYLCYQEVYLAVNFIVLSPCRMEAVCTLCSQGLENACSIYPGLSKLQALVELEEVGQSLSSNR